MTLSNTLYWTMFGWVLLGEVVAIYGLGYPLFMVLSKKNRMFYPMILATRNTDFRW